MRSEDRSALHEALEQQTVSIAKAGIMATLNSRCSVLAAANPKFGRFDRFKILAEQIDLPSPILSRFDLIFVVEDKPSVKGDSELAQHILQIHQQNTVNYEIEPELLRKYIAYARKNVNPKLTDEANMVLKEFYVSTRNSSGDEESPVPITARQLEAIIRLAEASAKIRLKDTVDKEDAQKAVRLQLACLKEVGVDPETGSEMFYINGEDGSRETTIHSNEANKVIIGSPDPKLTGGLTNFVSWKFIDLNFTLTYSLGGHAYDAATWLRSNGGTYNYVGNVPAYYKIEDTWKQPGDNAKLPLFAYGNKNTVSSRWMMPTDHLRLKNLTIGFTLPSNLSKKAGISKLRAYISGNNLLTWKSKDLYVDPETPVDGLCYFETPALRTITFGIELGF
jgi:hypothetical protein